ncbi:MAG: gliding motility-associated C-terminal domain-containing protein, partial [Bacteroidota bacterium]
GNFIYEWTTASGGNIDQPTAISTEVDAAGWYFLTVRRLDNGCTASDSTQVIASSQPIAGAAFSLIQPSCEDPEGYILIDSVFGGSPEFSYSLNGGIFIDYPQFSFLDPGEHEVQIQDENGCEWDTTIMLLPPGEIQVELGDDIFISQGESASFEAQLNVPGSQLDTVIWQNLGDSTACPTCLEQTVFPTKTTTYRITVIDTGGCMASDRITVWVNEESPFFVPTAFSPNGDGINDVLLLFAGKDIPIVHSFMIFDRWGNLVFSAEEFQPNDPAVGWDGNFNGEVLNAQVLVWKAEVGFLDGGREVFFGDVTLMR